MSDENTKQQLSIHPRSWPGGSREKVHTSKKKLKTTVERVMRGIEGHLERHPRDDAAKGHLKLCTERLNAL